MRFCGGGFCTLIPAGNSFNQRGNGMQATLMNNQVSVEVIKNDIATKMDSACFSAWFAPLSFTLSDGALVLSAPNQFTADFINSTYKNVLDSVACQYGVGVRVCVVSVASSVRRGANDNNVQTYSVPAQNDKTDDFDAFVECAENAFVVSACKKMAAGNATFSPLFIYGPAGSGKSMLAGCVNSVSRGRTIMMSGATFVSEFARALHDHTIFAFKDYCRNCDTFIMDDVQVLSGKRATCDEFLQLVIDLRNAGKNVILTADAAPGNLTGFDHRAQSLLASGLVADVVAPTRAVRMEMLVRAGLDSKLADTIAGRVAANGHVVAGIVNKIRTYTEIMGERVNEVVVEKLLADTLKKSKSPIVMVKSMCEKLGVSYDAVCGTGRSRGLVLARQMMMVVLKRATNLSLEQIGEYVGGRDHATVMYGISRIEKLQNSDLVMSAQIAEMVDEYK